MFVRLIAALLLLGIAFAPALSEAGSSGQFASSEEQDPWKEQTPKELDEDALEKELSHAPLNTCCYVGTSSSALLLGDEVVSAHFLESPLDALRHLRI